MQGPHVEYYVDLKRRLESLPSGERGPCLDRASAFLGRSLASLYRDLQRVGYDSGRKPRKDCGVSCVDRELALTAAGIVRKAVRANGKKTLPLTTTLDMLRDNGLGVDTGEGLVMPSPGTVARAMRLYGCHPEQVAKGNAARSMRSLHPNHVWQMDASVCVLFYLPAGKVAVLDETTVNEKKPAALAKLNQQRVVRWVIADHYSAAIYAEYTLGTENTESAIEVLINAMCKRGETDLMHGAPRILYTDKGSAYVSALMRSFLRRIGVRDLQHEAGNARATGSVEKAHDIVETQFEGRLSMLDITSLDQLNAHLTAWRTMYNATQIVRRHGRTRNAVWMTITPEQLRVPLSVEALRAVSSGPPKLTKIPPSLVLEYTPKGYERQSYALSAIEGIQPGRYIGVSLNPFDAPAIDVLLKGADGVEHTYLVQPIRRDRVSGFDLAAPVFGQEHKAMPDTAVDRAIKEMDKAAYAVATLEEAAKAKKSRVRPYPHINPMADVEAARTPTYLPRRGQDLDLAPRAREAAPLSHVEAARRLVALTADLGVAWDRECMEQLKAQYPASVPEDALEGFAASLAAARNLKPATGADAGLPALRLAVGGM